MICPTCGSEHDAMHRQECFRCHVKGVGFTWKGGAIVGRGGWNKTHREHLEEHFGVSSGTELARTQPNVERAPK